jgi:peptidoglycan/LPS O-acetylase OafA/YrhL
VSTASASDRQYYRPELDLLRFAAFLMVFLSHVVPGEESFFAQAFVPRGVAAVIISMAAGGAFGVDLFFVLSSFLLTTLLIRERRAYGTVDVASFCLRRALRIWPLYYIFLLLIAPLVQYILPGDHLPAKYLLAFAFLSGNWACVAWGYPHSVAGPLWSVSIEEQFYLIWPWIVRCTVRYIPAVALTLLLVSVLSRFALFASQAIHPQVWCNTLARLDPIAGGALLAVAMDGKENPLCAWRRSSLLLFGTAVLTAAGRYGDFTGAKALMTFPAVSVACVALLRGTLGLRLPCGNPVIGLCSYLGRISYGLYIFHWLFVGLFAVTSAHAPVQRVDRIAVALLATIATAAGSYRWLEEPFLRLKGRFTRVKSSNPALPGRTH